MALSRSQTVFVLRALGLGDFLTGLPALRALARALPDHAMMIGMPRGLEPLLALTGLPATVWPVTDLSAAPRMGRAPSIAVNLHGSGPQSHRLIAALRPGRMVAYGCPDVSVEGPAWDDAEHEVRRWCRLVSTAFGVDADVGDLLIERPGHRPAVADAVVIHPGAAHPARRWPTDRFAAVASWADRQGWPVVVTGGSDETGLAEEVRRAAGVPGERVLAGRTGLAELAALVGAARLVVTGDTGVAHLASAFRTPSVVLFGPTPPSRWGPPRAGPHAALWKGTTVGNPFGTEIDPALLEISVEDVVEAAQAVLRLTAQLG
ncbi:MAG: ADP-heptose--lipooligosaccharide heptosyltransferase II [uncultured Nocardioidaceae bacterium]|uniref:ADP-heptose--lipooligosaccharide heptosyltransferase II n=1 Tax=uncultured Nocardioidaceae bacterium TaxID=253824 RepID=A0A6J4MFQ8_9ACTN|nr:MAG: ADP-heptose--lipooligosaccharide heptosyltransferase II [uncultured Nocardioidaceae bacterium]